jgi:hypothetical protein
VEARWHRDTTGDQVYQVLQRICAVSGGRSSAVIDCRADLAAPLALGEDALWDAIDDLLAAGFVSPAQERGVRVRLTARGVHWCQTLPRRLAIAHRMTDTR